MIKRFGTMLFIAMMAVSLYGCGSGSGESLKDRLEEKASAKTAEAATQETTEEPEEAEEEITLDDACVWYVQDIWNPITDFFYYSIDNKGNFDVDFAITEFQKNLEEEPKYTEYIHNNHPDIVYAWDKMMEQVYILNDDLSDGLEIGDDFNVDLLNQYDDSFLDYARE